MPTRSIELYLGTLGFPCGLETAAQSSEVVDSECAEQVAGCWSAEADSETFGYVHGGFTTITLTEGDLHTSHRARNCRKGGHNAGDVSRGVVSVVSQHTNFVCLSECWVNSCAYQTARCMCSMIVHAE